MAKRKIIITDIDHERLEDLLASEFATVIGPFDYLDDLRAELDRAQIVSPQDVPRNVVTMNSTVVLSEPETGARRTCTLVYPEDRDLFADAVNILQELGGSILGHSVGDMVEVRETGKVRRLLIESITYQPEAAGDEEL